MGRTLIKSIWKNDGRQDGEKEGQDSKVDGKKTELNGCRLKANSSDLNRLKQQKSGCICKCGLLTVEDPLFLSWVQAPQHTRTAPPSNWEKLDGPVPFSMISFPIYKGSKMPRNASGNWREAGRRWNHWEQQKPSSIPERQKKKKRENTRPGCVLLNTKTR